MCMRCFSIFNIIFTIRFFTLLIVLITAVSLEIIWIVVIDFANLIMQTKVTLFERLLHPFDVHVISSSFLSTTRILICPLLSGSSHKSKTGLVVGIVIALVVVLFLGGLLFFWCRGRDKGYRREVFVDVPGLSFFFRLQCYFIRLLLNKMVLKLRNISIHLCYPKLFMLSECEV